MMDKIEEAHVSVEVSRTGMVYPNEFVMVVNLHKDLSHLYDKSGWVAYQVIDSVIKGLPCHGEPYPYFGSQDGLTISSDGSPYHPFYIHRKNILTLSSTEIAKQLAYCINDNFRIVSYIKQIDDLKKSRTKRTLRYIRSNWHFTCTVARRIIDKVLSVAGTPPWQP